MYKCLDPYGFGKIDFLTLKSRCQGEVDEETICNLFNFADNEGEGEFEYVKFLENLFDDGKRKKGNVTFSANKKR